MSALDELLEDFSGSGSAAQAGPVIEVSEVEGLKLEAFENGYKAGWDDAAKAQSEDRDKFSSNFAQHLQDLSFTYHEAYAQVMQGVTPLLQEVVASMLPAMAQAALGAHIVEQLEHLARSIGHMEVQVAVSPVNVNAILPLLETDFGFPLQVVQDETLADEQADIRFGETEKQIDLSDLITSIENALAGFAYNNQRKTANG